MPWLAHHNSEINWRTGEVKMTRCPEECGKQWGLVQGKSGWEKQKEEEDKEEAEKRKEEAKKLVPESFHRWIKVLGKK